MNKHVPPPAEHEAKSQKAQGPAGSALKERPARRPAESKEPKPGKPEQPQSEQRQAEETHPANARPDSSPAGTQGSGTPAEGFWTKRNLTSAGIAAAAVLGLLVWRPWVSNEPKITYSFARSAYGDVTVRVSSTAILEPRDVVEVTAQTGGRVESLLVKSGDHVTKGQLLARLISSSARDDRIAAQAEFAARQANVARSEADVAEARADVLRARAEAKPGAADAAQGRLAHATANLAEARALLRAGEETLTAARAGVQNLDVRAPVDGIVLKIDPNAEPNAHSVARGQSLVTMAADLSQMKLRADFSESALGRLHPGERAEFTVPAFPRESFAATLTALDVWPKRERREEREIVTYGGELTAVNAKDLLRPGMTAHLAIVVAEAKNVLVVPNAALTFVPPPKIEAKFPPLKASSGMRMGRVWVLRAETPEPRDVSLGLSDGRVTQIVSGVLRADENVVTSALIAAARS